MSWLWRGNDTSAASFEKVLAKLSTQISTASVTLDKTRSRSRRVKVLWTLYTTLLYLIAALIVLLVIGPQECGLPHYAGLAGTPGVIYGGRKAITAIYGWQISRQQAHLERLQKQREEKIAELKKATRFDSTQELLSKYGGAPTPKKEEKGPDTKRRPEKPQQQSSTPIQRTNLPPPPTANIPGRRSPQALPPQAQPHPQSPHALHQSPVQMTPDEPGFAPNAFSQPPPQAPPSYQASAGPNWYDRILDVMLGEDETAAKNRLVLLCANPGCRLVNGQAPPGVKTAEDLGRWRCQACGSWNGVEIPTTQTQKPVDSAEKRHRRHTTGVEGFQTASPPVEEVPEAEEEEEETRSIDEQEGATGRDEHDAPTNVTKRVTRSAGKPEVDGL